MKKALLTSALALASAMGFAQNPIITTSYTPDPAPYVHGDKLYMFTGHDEDDATYFKMNDWQVFSTEDMTNWTYLGTPISTETFKWAYHGDRAWAAQAVERNGKWYWYVCLNDADKKDVLAVAVADDPQGPYVDAIGAPLASGFAFIDPTVMIDDDGRAYLFWGNKGLWYAELNDDMISFKDGFKEVPGFHDPACFGPQKMKMNWAKGKEELMVGFEEGPWVSKRGDLYYLTYPAGGVPEHMAYSTAPTIHGPWTYRGRIMDEAQNSFTIHGGEVTFKGHNYMFYHNGSIPNAACCPKSCGIWAAVSAGPPAWRNSPSGPTVPSPSSPSPSKALSLLAHSIPTSVSRPRPWPTVGASRPTAWQASTTTSARLTMAIGLRFAKSISVPQVPPPSPFRPSISRIPVR